MDGRDRKWDRFTRELTAIFCIGLLGYVVAGWTGFGVVAGAGAVYSIWASS